MQLQIVGTTGDNDLEPAADFDSFWTLYPRHEAKRDALKAWGQIPASDHLPAIVAAMAWRRVWAGKETQFIPLPATWLRGGRYEDEIPREYAMASSASHVPAVLPVSNEREAMPESVRAMIAKLRKGAK
jgi:hypothetical protein